MKMSILLVVALLTMAESALGQNSTNTPPVITLQPQSQAVFAGSNVTFSVAVSGEGPFTYQWQFNGTNLPGSLIQTVAGTGAAAFSGDGRAATNASFNFPSGLAFDALGNLFVTDSSNHRIRKVSTNGIVVTVAGNGVAGYSGDGGAATNASLQSPSGITLDATGNLFIADWNNHRVRKVDTNGIITTAAGTGSSGYGGDGDSAINATLNCPAAVTLDAAGNLFIADGYNHRIRKVDTNGIITTVAGKAGSGYSGDLGPATNASLYRPLSVFADAAGNLFIADTYNQRVRKVSGGIITTVAGMGASGASGDGGAATNASLFSPSDVAVDAAGNLFIADTSNNRIRQMDTNGIITTVAGTGRAAFSGDGGLAANAGLNYPGGLTLDAAGNLFIGDCTNNRVRKVLLHGSPVVSVSNAGFANMGSYSVVVSNPYGSVTSSVAGLTLVGLPLIGVPPQSQAVTVGSNAVLTVIALGSSPLAYQWQFGGSEIVGGTTSSLELTSVTLNNAGSYSVIVSNAYGCATSFPAKVNVGDAPVVMTPPASQAVALGSNVSFNVTVSGTGPFTYQWMFNGTNLPARPIQTIAGNHTAAGVGDEGPAIAALVRDPYGMAMDATGNLFIADSGNHRIRKIDTNDIITTVAGNGNYGYSGDGGAATNACLWCPYDMAVDTSGNLFITDSYNNRIRKVDATGIITTVAGKNSSGYSGDGGAATNASLSRPCGLALDARGNLFIADSGTNRVRRVGTNGVIITFAGNGIAGYSGDGGRATNASFRNPWGLAVDAGGNLYITDCNNNCIRRVDTNGVVTTVAGNGTAGYSGDGGLATNASLRGPGGMAWDSNGNLYVADQVNHCIRCIDAKGIITTVAGSGVSGYSGDGGEATNATLYGPRSVALDADGNLLIADGNNYRIRKVFMRGPPALVLDSASFAQAGAYSVVVSSPYGSAISSVAVLTVLGPPAITVQPQSQAVAIGSNVVLTATAAGTAPLAYQWQFDGSSIAGATSASLALTNITWDSAGNYAVVVTNAFGSITSSLARLSVGYAPDISIPPAGQAVLLGLSASFSVAVSGTGPFTYQWRCNGTNLPNNLITTIAGKGTADYSGDGGAATNAGLNTPYAAAMDAAGNLFIADSFNNRIRRVDPNGVITTFAGNGSAGYSGDGVAATNASLRYPSSVAMDSGGNLLIADDGNSRIRRVDPNGVITTVAGNGSSGYSGDGGAATNAGLSDPRGVAMDAAGNLFIVECSNSRIRKVDTNGIITTVAGKSGSPGYSGDGGAATNASLYYPFGVAVDNIGSVFIADSSNNRIRRVDANGIITTIAGNGSASFSGDRGAATNASLHQPNGVAVDAAGNVFIADEGNNRVRKVDTNGIITTVAGTGSQGSFGDGGPATNANLCLPYGVAVDAAGNLLVADTINYCIREVYLHGTPTLWLNNLAASHAGNYTVVVSSPYGSITSSVAVLTVLRPPSIVVQPHSQAVVVGSNAVLSVTAVGTGLLAYQWQFNRSNLPDATTSSLVLSTVTPDSAGAYSVIVTNAYGSITSRVAKLSVGYAPVISSPPASQAVVLGGDVTFNVTPAGTGPFRYQWQFNGANLPALIVTVAGNGSAGGSGNGGSATNARLNLPYGLAIDAVGNLFIADRSNHCIRKVDTNGMITLAAGNGSGGFSGDGGAATNASLYYPSCVAFDNAGNLFIADRSNHRVRKVDINGVIATIAGNGSLGNSGDGGAATNAALYYPSGVAFDADGSLFIADSWNNRVRRVDLNGIITTVAGKSPSGGYSGDGGAATNASLYFPTAVALDADGNLFIADNNNHRIRKVDCGGTISTVAGGGYFGDGVVATDASLSYPSGVALDSAGNFFIADCSHNRVRKVDAVGVITTVAGKGTAAYSGDGGAAANASLNGPNGVAVDAGGNLFIADTTNSCIREVFLQGLPALTLRNLGLTNAGSYRVVVSSPYGSVTSDVESLTILRPPSITTQPQGQVVTVGSNAVLSVTAVGTSPLAYQWQFAGTNLAGATDSGLALMGVTPDSAGSYCVVVANPYGSATSQVAKLDVGYAPAIATPPASQAVLLGGSAVFRVGVSGTGPFTYQWLRNGSNLLNGLIVTIAGKGNSGYSGDGGTATDAALHDPRGVTCDSAGNLFIADGANHRLRRVDTNGIITTVAGSGSSGYFGDGGPATNASLYYPSGIAVDAQENVFFADSSNNRIRKIDTNGIIRTVAGNGTAGYAGDGGAATNASLRSPTGVAVDASGNLLIADYQNSRVRKVDTSGIIRTVAGNGTDKYSGDGGAATNASLGCPSDVAVDASGNLFIADYFNDRIRKVDTSGIITTVAGTTFSGYSGDGAAAVNARLDCPIGVAADADGSLFIADSSNQRIRKVDGNGIIMTVAGNGTASYAGDGSAATNASLSYPARVAVDANGNLFIADANNNRVREVFLRGLPTLSLTNLAVTNAGDYSVVISSRFGSVTSSVAMLTLLCPPSITVQPKSQAVAIGSNAVLSVTAAGTGPLAYQWRLAGTDLAGATDSVLVLSSAILDSAGTYNVVVTNAYGSITSLTASLSVGYPPAITNPPASQVSQLGGSVAFTVGATGTGPLSYQWRCNGTNTPQYVITTVAGDGSTDYSGGGVSATNTGLYSPCGVVIEAAGNLYIADSYHHRIRKVDTNGMMTIVAGDGAALYAGDGGAATNASLYRPYGVAVDGGGNLFIADSYNHRIRKVGANGVIQTVAGNGTNAYTGDGGAATNASLYSPRGVAVDGGGNLFIADCSNHRIRKVDTNGVIATIVGSGNPGYAGDGGVATNARLNYPSSVILDSGGNLFIADVSNNRIRRVDTNGIITTVAGTGAPGYSSDGVPATNASLNCPSGLTLDAAGNLFIADYYDHRVRMVDTKGMITTVAGNGLGRYFGDGGAGPDASVYDPYGLAVGSGGHLFIADSGNNRIRRVILPLRPELSLHNLALANAGDYSVVVSSPYGTVTSAVAVLSFPPPRPVVLPGDFALLPAGAFTLSFLGCASISYTVLASTNLVDWIALGPASEIAPGQFQFTDPGASNQRARYYRIRSP